MGDHKVRQFFFSFLLNKRKGTGSFYLLCWVIIFTHFLVLILMIHSFNYYGAACFSGVSNESLSIKVPIYELSACSYLGFSIHPPFLLASHYPTCDYIEACWCSWYSVVSLLNSHSQ